MNVKVFLDIPIGKKLYNNLDKQFFSWVRKYYEFPTYCEVDYNKNDLSLNFIINTDNSESNKNFVFEQVSYLMSYFQINTLKIINE